MTEEWTALDVTEATFSGIEYWKIRFARPTDDVFEFIMPKYTLRARAIEYGFDFKEQFPSVLQLVVHELWIPPEWELKADDRDPGFKEGYKTPIDGVMTPGHIWTAETIQDAREARQLRMLYVQDNKHVMNLDPLSQGASGGFNQLYRGRQAYHPVLDDLAISVWRHRRRVRGREDGRPLKG